MNLPIKKIPDHTFVHMNKDGTLEVVDMYTGKVLAVQKSREALLIGDVERAKEITLEDGSKVWIEKKLVDSGIQINQYVYSELQAEAIATLVADGISLRNISLKPGFPPMSVIRRWRIQFPEFAERLKIARQDRAEYFSDKAVEAAELALNKDDTPAKKLQVETYKWMAGVDDPDLYGVKKATSTAEVGSLTIIIDTGIRREGDMKDITPGKAVRVSIEKESAKEVQDVDSDDFVSRGEIEIAANGPSDF